MEDGALRLLANKLFLGANSLPPNQPDNFFIIVFICLHPDFLLIQYVHALYSSS